MLHDVLEKYVGKDFQILLLIFRTVFEEKKFVSRRFCPLRGLTPLHGSRQAVVKIF